MQRPTSLAALALAASVAGAMGGCATEKLIPNTRVPDTLPNREIVDTVERYRQALERRDPARVLALASPNYFEDSGTPRADDDYGFDGLRKVLMDRMAKLRSVRYAVEYRRVTIAGKKAEVEVYIDASFQLAGGDGVDRYRRVTEFNKLELEHDGKRWLFTRGM